MFSIERKVASREELAVINNAHKIGETWELLKEPKPGTIPVGSVEYCQKSMPVRCFHDIYHTISLTGCMLINYYPQFLSSYKCRDISRQYRYYGDVNIDEPAFFKNALEYKSSFDAKVYLSGSLPEGTYWRSDIVNFVQEWRYYVAKGELITTGWYSGDNEDEPAPELDVDWPKDFSGAVDFGRLDDGRIALVESHPPFACGWYGENGLDYVRWLQNSWKEIV